jgi:hypothetical protein
MAKSLAQRAGGLLFLALTFGACAFAQTARLSGHVNDPEGIPVTGATVQVIHQGDLVAQKTTSDETGAYSVTQLAAGDYQIVVDAVGFDTYKSQIVHLAADQALAVDVQVVIAAAKSEVTVSTESGAQVTLDTAALSGTLEAKEVTSYGLNGRNFSQLVALTPGVSNQTGQDEAKVGVAGSAKFSVNGGRVEYNTFEVDGSDVLNTSINASRGQGLPLMVYPSVDAIEEMQVLTSNYGAMYGKSASGSVLVTTKSGTSAFHGNVYGFIRNEMFNARNYFDPAEPVNPLDPNAQLQYRTPLYRRQDYGGTIGGPLYIPGHYNTKKDKTYFFWSEELRLDKTPVDYNQAVPTVAERSGDFSDVCPYNPTGGYMPTAGYPDCPVTDTSTGAPRSTGFVNANYLSQSILGSNTIPLPNAPSGCNSTNTSTVNHCYVAAVSPATYWREELFRIDQTLTPTQLLSFRYIHDSWNTTTLTPQWGVVQNSFPTVENKLIGPGLDMVLSLAQSLPHSFQNRVSFAFSVEHISLATETGPGVTSLARPAILDNAGPSNTGGAAVAGYPACSVVTGPQPTPPSSLPNEQPQQFTECPMGHIFNNGFGGKMPGLVFQGNNGAYGGHGFNVDTGYAPWKQSNPSYLLRDDASKLIGQHSLQFGFEATLSQQNETSAVSGADSGDLQGLLTFSNQQSRYTTGNAFADFLAGPGLLRLAANGTGLQPATTDYTGTAIKSFTQDSGQGRYYNRYKAVEFYVQDDWHVTNRLTVNLGFRGSLFGAWYNPNNTAYNWEPQAYSRSLGSSIYIDPNYGELVRTTGTGTAGPGSLPTVPLNLNNLDPVITNGLVQCGKNGVPSSCMANHLFNPAPRIGFAWDPQGDGRTSVRAGYGLFWEHGIGNEANTGSLIGSAPLVLSETQSNPTGVDIGPGGTGLTASGGASSIAGPLNSLGLVSSGFGSASAVTAGTFPLNVTAIPTQQHYSYTQQWSLSIQRELLKDLVGTIAYVGTKGTHLTAIRDLNQLPAVAPGLNPFAPGQPITSGICGAGAATGVFPVNGTFTGSGVTSSAGIGPNQPGYLNAFVACTGSSGFETTGSTTPLGVSADALRPYLGFSNIISLENIADSQYHALQATLRRTKGSLTLGATYTYSHGLDDSSDRSSANFADSLNIKSNWSSSDFDERHLINFSYIYDLPLVRLISYFTHFLDEDQATASPAPQPPAAGSAGPSIVNALFDHWQLSGITVYQSGTPFSVVNGGGQVGCATPLVKDSCQTSFVDAADIVGGIATADNGGVGNGLGIGSYPDINPGPHGTRPVISADGSTIGPLLGNPRAFVAPRGLTFGNAGRNSMNNPARTNFNMSLLKTFKAFRGLPVEFRIEAFNVFNHTQFRIYDPSHPGNTGNNIVNCYGDISTGYSAGAPGCVAGNSFLHPVDAHDPRILQLGLKLAF